MKINGGVFMGDMMITFTYIFGVFIGCILGILIGITIMYHKLTQKESKDEKNN